MKPDRYTVLAQRGPEWARLITNLRRIESAIASIPLEPFFEPVAELARPGNDQTFKLAAITAPLLNAWTRHIAYGTIVRLTDLTRPCLDLLGSNQLIAAGLVERSILEHAARAAYSLQALKDARLRKSWENLRELIPRVLLGTCLTEPEDTIFEDMAELAAQRPVKVSKLLDALEAFAGTGAATGKSFFGGLYAVLCDLTHASQRGNSALCDVLAETETGWFLKYRRDEAENARA